MTDQNAKSESMTIQQKALKINLDKQIYGTFAEIGAGQEVARFFFQAGGANGTVAKSISAYDMAYSTAMYGECARFVCEDRVNQMLDAEYNALIHTIGHSRADETTFFAFSDTVAAKSYTYNRDYHGWLGIKFQQSPRAEASRIIIHVRMLDEDRLSQAIALGIVGVNLMYAAFYHKDNLEKLIDSLQDNLSNHKIEIDFIKFDGAGFESVDNRLQCLKLIQNGLTNAVMFDPIKGIVQPAEALYKKSVILQRGSFRPVTHVNIDIMENAIAQFVQEKSVQNTDVLPLMEITLSNLMSEGGLDLNDFLARVDILMELGYTVLISNYLEFYRLNRFLSNHTKNPMGIALGIKTIRDVFNDKYYDNLEGGILEAFGKLFSRNVKMYVYPELREDGRTLVKANNFVADDDLEYIYQFLTARGSIVPIKGYNREFLSIFSRQVLKMIAEGNKEWIPMVPDIVAKMIMNNGYFGWEKSNN